MAVIDVHTHAFPDSLAARALAKLEAGCPWKAVGDGTIKGLLASMDRADVDISLICTIATSPEQVEGILNWCKKIRTDRIEPFPSIHPDTPDIAGWMQRIADEAFVGIKLHPQYQNFAADEARMDPIWQAACDLGLIVTVHCGLDIAYPETNDNASPARFRNVIDRYPELTLICTHMGGWRAWEQSMEQIIGHNVYIETSFSIREMPADMAIKMIRKHGADKVMFGTDWPWVEQSEDVQTLLQLGLCESETDAILYKNAAQLLGY